MKNKQGISLIVLVITIIVMIVLAGAIVLTLNNSGIIDKATNSVIKTNYNTVKELASMAWAEAYADGARTEQALQERVDEVLKANKIDKDDYGVYVTTNGITVGWIQDGLTVKRGKTVLAIGSDFEYDAGVDSYSGSWKVLGAEDGELLIMSTVDIVSSYALGAKTSSQDLQVFEEAKNGWLNGAAELDALCKPYGKGENATGARSIRVEDVDKITGFDKATYGKGQINEYGNTVTFSYNGTTMPAYVGTNGKTGKLNLPLSYGLHFYNGKKFVHVNDLTTGTNGTIFATIKNDYYYYFAPFLETIDETSDAYTMLFGEYDEIPMESPNAYWLASPYVDADDYWGVDYGMRIVENGYVSRRPFWDSWGTLCPSTAVRAVVSLAADIQV